MLGVSAVALFLTTVTDSALSAALGAMAFLIASTLLLTLDAAASLQPYLPTRYWLAFVHLFRDPSCGATSCGGAAARWLRGGLPRSGLG